MASQPNNVTPIKEPPIGLALLRAPFPDNQVSKLPKETKAQIDARKADKNQMVFNCGVCGGHHHKNAVHLDYVGHAALTDRLLDTDPAWYWEPLATTDTGLPAFDQSGGLWIKLHVLGVQRLGYGHAATKPTMDPGAREKEVIGDALRNAAMRFGAALDLWHKGDLHVDDEPAGADAPGGMPDAEWAKLVSLIEATKADTGAMLKHYAVTSLRMLNQDQYAHALGKLNDKLAAMVKAETEAKLVAVTPAKSGFGEVLGDEIPY